MSYQNKLKDVISYLISHEKWLGEAVSTPRNANHGSDPRTIDCEIIGQPVVISFKFRKKKTECCINLRVLSDEEEFSYCINKHYGAQMGNLGIGIRGRTTESYFKPFGVLNGNKTKDIYFPAENPFDIFEEVQVLPCHAMPNGGKISLFDAVMLIINKIGAKPGEISPKNEINKKNQPIKYQEKIPENTSDEYKPRTFMDDKKTMPLINKILHFIYENCTEGKTENKNKFISELKLILEKTTLTRRTPNEIWHLMWDKPIYASQKNDTATKVIQKCREGHIFDNFEEIPESKQGQPKILEGLRSPDEKLERIRRLSQVVYDVHRLYEDVLETLDDQKSGHAQDSMSADFESLRDSIGVLRKTGNQPNIYQEIHNLKGFGGITELHILMDFGFPVCKPDIWLTRALISILKQQDSRKLGLSDFIMKKYPEFDLEKLNDNTIKNKPWYSFRALDYIVQNEIDFDDKFFQEHDIDIKLRFRAHRLADLMLAKLGMQREQRFGLVRSPKDQLKIDRRLQDRWPDLANLAAALDRK